MGHYDGKEFEKILQEAQANMMKGIPNLDVEENQTILSATPAEQVDTPGTVESPTGKQLHKPNAYILHANLNYAIDVLQSPTQKKQPKKHLKSSLNLPSQL